MTSATEDAGRSGCAAAPAPSAPAAPDAGAGVLAALVDNAQDQLVYLDRDFNFVFVNRAYADGCRRRPDELVGRNHFELFPHAENEAIFARARATGEPAVWREKPFVFPDQPERGLTYWDWTLTPVKEAGQVVGFVFSLRDVTASVAARRRAEAAARELAEANAALRRSELRFRRLVEVSSQIVWVTRPDGAVVEDSPSWRAFTGRSYADWAGWAWLDVVHPDDRAAVEAAWTAAVTGVRPYLVEFRMRAAGGEYRHVVARSAPILNEDGAVLEWIGMNTDVTDRRRAEEVLRRSEAKYRAFFETLREAVTVLAPVRDAAGAIVDWRYRDANALALALLGRTREALVDRTVSEVLGPGALAARAERYRDVLDSGEPYAYEDALAGRHLLVSVSRIDDGLVAASALDLTERKQMELALQEADRRKNDFIGVLSHELRNPLAPILNGVELLERAPAGGAQAQRALGVIRRQVELLRRLTDDLLDVTRIARGKVRLAPAPTELGELVARAAEDHLGVFERAGVALRVERPAAPLVVEADAARLSQVLGNLLQNAAKFTPRGGDATLAAALEGGEVVLRVRDSGVGLDPETRARLFEPFVQADRSLDRTQGGLGLGLALVHGLVELHGGTVEARSPGPGRGTEFVVRLPARRAAAAAPRAARPAAAPSGRRVLVVEDNRDAAETLCALLALDGHACEVALDGPEALAKAAAFRPDVVLCDIGLPGMSGYDVARALRADPALARTRLVALSGYARPEDVAEARAAGFHRHLSKPPRPEDLEAVLRP